MTNQIDDSKFPLSLLLRANKLKQAEDYLTAADVYAQGIAVIGDSAQLFAAIADCYFAASFAKPDEEGRRHGESALRWMEQAVNLAPSIGRFHARLAQYYSLVSNNYDKAATEYRKAISLTPNDVAALIGATSLYGVPDEVVSLDEAIAWQERAVSLEPDNPNYHVRLAGLYEEGGRAVDAVREWTLALLCPEPLVQRSTPKVELALPNRENDKR